MASHAALAKTGPKPFVSLANEMLETLVYLLLEMAAAFPISEVGRNKGGHPHLLRDLLNNKRLLASGSSDTTLKENSKSTSTDGKLQQ